jgi:hypothetical protein
MPIGSGDRDRVMVAAPVIVERECDHFPVQSPKGGLENCRDDLITLRHSREFGTQ